MNTSPFLTKYLKYKHKYEKLYETFYGGNIQTNYAVEIEYNDIVNIEIKPIYDQTFDRILVEANVINIFNEILPYVIVTSRKCYSYLYSLINVMDEFSFVLKKLVTNQEKKYIILTQQNEHLYIYSDSNNLYIVPEKYIYDDDTCQESWGGGCSVVVNVHPKQRIRNSIHMKLNFDKTIDRIYKIISSKDKELLIEYLNNTNYLKDTKYDYKHNKDPIRKYLHEIYKEKMKECGKGTICLYIPFDAYFSKTDFKIDFSIQGEIHGNRYEQLPSYANFINILRGLNNPTLNNIINAFVEDYYEMQMQSYKSITSILEYSIKYYTVYFANPKFSSFYINKDNMDSCIENNHSRTENTLMINNVEYTFAISECEKHQLYSHKRSYNDQYRSNKKAKSNNNS